MIIVKAVKHVQSPTKRNNRIRGDTGLALGYIEVKSSTDEAAHLWPLRPQTHGSWDPSASKKRSCKTMVEPLTVRLGYCEKLFDISCS